MYCKWKKLRADRILYRYSGLSHNPHISKTQKTESLNSLDSLDFLLQYWIHVNPNRPNKESSVAVPDP